MPPRRRSRWWWLGPLASIVIFGASLVVLWYIVQEIEPGELAGAFANASLRQLGLAGGFTALSYLLLTGYDALALKRLGLSIPYRTTALASFTSYSVSFTLGFPIVTGGTVRYWIYSPKGVRASEVASLTVIAGLTFWLGLGAILCVSLFYATGSVATLARTSPLVVQLVGAAVGLGTLVYLSWIASGERTIRVRGWNLPLPGLAITLGQMFLGATEVCAAAAVLFVLLPGGHGIDYPSFLAVYVFACLVGIASHAPGGLGVFEATMLVALSRLPFEHVLGALLIFRIVYYILPFILALVLLALNEMVRRIRRHER
ncbi:lysylphosphatidylglycerol synthase domain-containing protein [Bosea sp. 124]|uniref:lysylphosphatidylglycerol synthase domain-containing protein n=1 Tax=Bosea sp. 124 TaxID=2135642 RepID=UPI0015E64600|nr:lysylphosphatidylglycerol synthase domain-containing protein [Bosea sp. 124]